MAKYKMSHRSGRKIYQKVIMGVLAAVLSLGLLGSSMIWTLDRNNVPSGISPQGNTPQQVTSAELEEKAKASPNDVNILQDLARAYEKEGQTAKASETYEKAISLAPDRDDLKTRLAASYILTNQNDRATTMLQELIAKNPNNKDAHYFYGHALVAKKDYEKAAGEFEEYIRLAGDKDPEVENARKLVETLKSLIKK